MLWSSRNYAYNSTAVIARATFFSDIHAADKVTVKPAFYRFWIAIKIISEMYCVESVSTGDLTYSSYAFPSEQVKKQRVNPLLLVNLD